MTNYQNAQVQMMAAVKATADTHQPAWTGFAPFADHYPTFTALLPQITDAVGLQQTSSTGTTEAKAVRREALEARLAKLSAALVVLGETSANEQLKQDARTTRRELDRMQEEELLGRSDRLRDLATANAAALAPLGIDAPFLTAFSAAHTQFAAAIGTPRHLIAEAVRGTADLAAAIDAALLVLTDKLDDAVALLAFTQPAFAAEWATARAIIEPGSTTRALAVTVIDNLTAEPLEGAEATIRNTTNPAEPPAQKTTGEQGGFYIQSLPAAQYQMTVTKAGYEPETVAFEVDAAGGLQLVVRMALG